MKFDFDVIVIGSGPGGSTVAWNLATAGVKTLLLDRETFPRVKVCAGWITPGIFRILKLDPKEYPHTLQTFSSGSVYINHTYHETDFSSVASYGIIRQEFDTFLSKRAVSAGATLKEGINVKSIDRNADGVCITAMDGQSWTAPIVVGAGGTQCPVARQWGEKRKEESIIIAQESETKIGRDKLQKLTPYYGTTELFPEPDFYGYGWYVTKGDWVNIGVGRFRHATKNFPEERDRFFGFIKSLGRVNGIEKDLVPFAGHSYKLYDETPRKLAGDRFVLIGDSGGFATKWAGEGIKPAVQTATFASQVIREALQKSDFSEKTLNAYRDLCVKEYGSQKSTMGNKILSVVPQGLKIAAATKVCTHPGLRRKIIFEKAFGFEETRLAVNT